jgi:hypothetical protein
VYGFGAGLSSAQSAGRAVSKPCSRNGIGGDVSRLLKRLRGPHSPRRLALVALTSCVALSCLAFVARGISWLRTPPDTRISVPAAEGGAAATGSARPVAPPPALSASQIGEQILARNIFDSASGPLTWELAGPAITDDAGVSASGAGPELGDAGRCGGDLRLLASVVRGSGAGRSLAALRKDGKTEIVTVGERLGELELVAVYPTGAYLRDGAGRTCSLPVYLSANEPPLPPPPPLAVAEAPAEKSEKKEPSEAELEARKKRPPAFTEEELARNIRKLGPTRYAVTRELFTRARMNPSGISRGARFKPQTRDGRAAGMQVLVLRDDSLLAHLGVQRGDLLRGINGFGLGSADGVLEAFGHLGKQTEVTLSIERDGTLSTIQYVLE